MGLFAQNLRNGNPYFKGLELKSIKIVIHILLGVCLLGNLAMAKKAEPKELPLPKKNAPFSVYELKGEQEGPTLLVIGGIHGDAGRIFCSRATNGFLSNQKRQGHCCAKLKP